MISLKIMYELLDNICEQALDYVVEQRNLELTNSLMEIMCSCGDEEMCLSQDNLNHMHIARKRLFHLMHEMRDNKCWLERYLNSLPQTRNKDELKVTLMCINLVFKHLPFRYVFVMYVYIIF